MGLIWDRIMRAFLPPASTGTAMATRAVKKGLPRTYLPDNSAKGSEAPEIFDPALLQFPRAL